jgi:hypothetical protein
MPFSGRHPPPVRSPLLRVPYPEPPPALLLPAPQDSEDIRYMVEALKVLGVQLTEDWANNRLVVQGCGGRFPSERRRCRAGWGGDGGEALSLLSCVCGCVFLGGRGGGISSSAAQRLKQKQPSSGSRSPFSCICDAPLAPAQPRGGSRCVDAMPCHACLI